MMDEVEKRGQLIRHLEEALALADEIEDGGCSKIYPVAQPARYRSTAITLICCATMIAGACGASWP
jgi:hypothetical protein